MAYDLLQYCYENDDRKAIEILKIKVPQFNNMSCFELADYGFEITKKDLNNDKRFIANECFQRVVSSYWRGKTTEMRSFEYLLYTFWSFVFRPFLFFAYYLKEVFLITRFTST